MLCINPYRKPSVEFGCGQCLPCRLNRRRTWTARIVLESLAYRDSCFLTLTYQDEHLPPGNSLSKEHWREFTNGIGFRYFGCGEYGSRYGRPHYHLVVFGLEASAGEALAAARWPYGFSTSRPFCRAHASYVASYVVKKMTRAGDSRLAEGQLPEFALMSRRPGVGVAGLGSFASWLQTEEGCKFLGENLDVPTVVRVDRSLMPLGRTLVRHLRDQVDMPSDVPARTMRREARFRAERSVPEFVAQLERKRVARYRTLKAISQRRSGVL